MSLPGGRAGRNPAGAAASATKALQQHCSRHWLSGTVPMDLHFVPPRGSSPGGWTADAVRLVGLRLVSGGSNFRGAGTTWAGGFGSSRPCGEWNCEFRLKVPDASTATSVPSCSEGTRERLRSSAWAMGAPPPAVAATVPEAAADPIASQSPRSPGTGESQGAATERAYRGDGGAQPCSGSASIIPGGANSITHDTPERSNWRRSEPRS